MRAIQRSVAQDQTITAHQHRTDNFIFGIDVQVALSIDDELKEVEHIACLQCTGIRSKHGRQIGFSNDDDAMAHYGTVSC